jgi:hypothetical protein
MEKILFPGDLEILAFSIRFHRPAVLFQDSCRILCIPAIYSRRTRGQKGCRYQYNEI